MSVFQLSEGPGPINYVVNPDGTVPYTGANFGSRTAFWRDPNLRNAYVMNWSGGFQYQPGSTWVVNMMYQGSAGVGLQRTLEHQRHPASRLRWAATEHCRIRCSRRSRTT